MKLIQLNIEHDRHLDRVLSFFEVEQPDVMCLQEVFEEDLHLLAERFGMHTVFAPMTCTARRTGDCAILPEGIALLSRTPFSATTTRWYFKPDDTLPFCDDTQRDTVWQSLLTGTVEHNGVPVVFGTTHFYKS